MSTLYFCESTGQNVLVCVSASVYIGQEWIQPVASYCTSANWNQSQRRTRNGVRNTGLNSALHRRELRDITVLGSEWWENKIITIPDWDTMTTKICTQYWTVFHLQCSSLQAVSVLLHKFKYELLILLCTCLQYLTVWYIWYVCWCLIHFMFCISMVEMFHLDYRWLLSKVVKGHCLPSLRSSTT